MNAFAVLSGFVPLLVMALLTVGVIRLARRARGDEELDPGAIVRQVTLYGLLYLTMILTAMGAAWVYDELTSSTIRRDNQALAQAMALLALGLPAFSALLAFVDRRLSSDDSERRSLAWSIYLTLASMTSLIGTMIGAYQIIATTASDRLDQRFDGRSVILLIVWGAFFGTHWFFLRTRHGVRGDLHLAAGSLVGFVPMAIGQAGLLAVVFDQLYQRALGRSVENLGSESAPWLALFIVGAAVWIGIWLRSYESGPRTEAWFVTVLPVGSLAGFVAILTTSAWAVYLVSVWLIGDPSAASAADHFDAVPEALAIGFTGGLAWHYYRSFLQEETSRTNAVRSYDYLLMGASLVAGLVGGILVLSSLIDDASIDRNQALAGITLLIVGGSTWSRLAARVVAHQAGDQGLHELSSPVRRSYLYATLGISGLAVLIAGISALEGIFEDILDSAVGYATVADQREQLSTVALVAGVLWFHAFVLRNDQRRLAADAPPPPMPPKPAATGWPARIIVLGSAPAQPLDVAEHPGTSVEYWHRTDNPSPPTDPLDLEILDESLTAHGNDDVLVLLNGDTPTIIPFER